MGCTKKGLLFRVITYVIIFKHLLSFHFAGQRYFSDSENDGSKVCAKCIISSNVVIKQQGMALSIFGLAFNHWFFDCFKYLLFHSIYGSLHDVRN